MILSEQSDFDIDPSALQVFDALRAHGADLEKVTEVLFYLYLPSEYEAKAAASVLMDNGFQPEVREPLPEYDNWLCLATKHMVLTNETITGARELLEELAARYNGDFDGWEAAVVK